MATRGHRAFEKQLDPRRPLKFDLHLEEGSVILPLATLEEGGEENWVICVAEESVKGLGSLAWTGPANTSNVSSAKGRP
jgi:hypothetical protein